MNFLKKIAGGIKALFTSEGGRQTVATVLNLVAPGSGSAFNAIAGIVVSVEAYFRAAFADKPLSAEKLMAALPMVEEVMKRTELLVGKDIVDEARFREGCTKIIGGFVDILHSVDVKKPQAGKAPTTLSGAGASVSGMAHPMNKGIGGEYLQYR